MNGIEKITERILADAAAHRTVLEEQTENQIADIQEKYDSECAYTLARARTQAAGETEEIRARGRAAAAMEHRRILLSRKSALVEEVYRRVEETLHTMPAEERLRLSVHLVVRTVREYREGLSQREALYGAGAAPAASTYDIVLCEKDLSAFGDRLISAVQAEEELQEEDSARLALCQTAGDFPGGVVVRFGEMEVNATWPMLLSAQRATGEGAVYAALFDA